MTDIAAPSMSDSSGLSDMRDRIAAAIMHACHGVYMDDAVDAADAVIADLRLSVTGGVIVGCLHE